MEYLAIFIVILIILGFIGLILKRQYMILISIIGLLFFSITLALLVIYYSNDIFVEGVALDKSIGYFGTLGLPLVLFYWEWKRYNDEQRIIKEKEKNKQDKLNLIKTIILEALLQGKEDLKIFENKRQETEEKKRLAEIEREQQRLRDEEARKNDPFGMIKNYASESSLQALLAPSTLIGEKSDSLRALTWSSIRTSISDKSSNDLEYSSILQVLKEIKFYFNNDFNHSTYLWVSDEGNNFHNLEAYIDKYYEDFQDNVYDYVILSYIKNKLFIE